MARGLPAIWSAVLSSPFLVGGAFLYLGPSQSLQLPATTIPPSNLRRVGILIGAFGLFISIVGVYVQFVAPTSPTISDDEEVVDTRDPSQRVAISKIIVGLPFLGAAAYLLFYTLVPYVYPTATLITGLYFFSSGVKTYWTNTLTSYYVTTRRVISEYRFISLRRQEIPLAMVRGIEERKSIAEALVGIGNIRVASAGGGGSVRVVMRNIGDSTGFADELRKLAND